LFRLFAPVCMQCVVQLPGYQHKHGTVSQLFQGVAMGVDDTLNSQLQWLHHGWRLTFRALLRAVGQYPDDRLFATCADGYHFRPAQLIHFFLQCSRDLCKLLMVQTIDFVQSQDAGFVQQQQCLKFIRLTAGEISIHQIDHDMCSERLLSCQWILAAGSFIQPGHVCDDQFIVRRAGPVIFDDFPGGAAGHIDICLGIG